MRPAAVEIDDRNEALYVDLHNNQEIGTGMVGFDTDTILLVLQTEREIWKAVESIEIDDDDENIAMNTALNILLHNAIEEFGRAPRDVYHGIFHLSETRDQHDAHVRRLTYAKLSDLVAVFAETHGLDEFSHHVVAVNVEQIVAARFDKWTNGQSTSNPIEFRAK